MKPASNKTRILLLTPPLALTAGCLIYYFNSPQTEGPPSVQKERSGTMPAAGKPGAPLNSLSKKIEGPDDGATGAFNPAWLAKYGLSVADLDKDPDHDGKSSREEMFANTDPLGGRFARQTGAAPEEHSSPNNGFAIQSPSQRHEALLEIGKAALVQSRESARQLRENARLLDIPVTAATGAGERLTLTGIDEDGTGVYAMPHDAAAADGSGVDELWPVNSWNFVTFPGGALRVNNPTGGTGFGLNGSGQVLRLWEAGGGVNPAHLTLTGRITQVDAGDQDGDGISDFDLHFHATEVAAQMLAAPVVLALPVGAETWDFGSQMRGMAFAATARSFFLNDLISEIPIEAAGDPANSIPAMTLGNFSFGTAAGWHNFGTDPAKPEWHWFGAAAATVTEDNKFGSYLGSVSSDIGPAQWDSMAQDAYTSLLVMSAGNDQEQGPGSLPAGGYFVGAGTTTTSSATRDWLDGDAGGYDTLPASACAKNVLTVGSVKDVSYDGNLSWDTVPVQPPVDATTTPVISGFSSLGPTDDGRIKPDIVAPGSRDAAGGNRNPFGSSGMLVSTIAQIDGAASVAPVALSGGNVTFGLASDGSDTVAVTGAGTGLLATNADAFHFANTSFSGDLTIITRVDAQSGASASRKAGIMMRETAGGTSTPGARSVSVAVVAGTQVQLVVRSAANANAVLTTVPLSGGVLPVWLKLQRTANAFTGSFSEDGVTWTQVGSTATVAIPAPYWAGFAASAGNANNTLTTVSTARFSRISFTHPINDSLVSAGSQGTSYSAPVVASGLSLILQKRQQLVPEWYVPSPAGSNKLGPGDFPVRSSTLRALAVHTARPVRTAGETATAYRGPDFKHGYGIFNAPEAIRLVVADAQTTNFAASPKELGQKPHLKEILLPTGGDIIFDVKAKTDGSPLKVTIAWNDPAGTPQSSAAVAGLDPADSAVNRRLKNDLDLRVFEPGNTNYASMGAALGQPWILNPSISAESDTDRSLAATTGDDIRNNLEQVVIQTPVSGGTYKVVIRHKGVMLTGDTQWVSVIMSGNDTINVPFVITSFYRPDPVNQPLLYNAVWQAPVGSVCAVEKSTDLVNWTVDSALIVTRTEQTTTAIMANSSQPFAFYRFRRMY